MFLKLVKDSSWNVAQRQLIAAALRELVLACKFGRQVDLPHMAVLVHVLPNRLLEAFKRVLAIRNGCVADFNQHFTGARGCNTAMYLLHNSVSARVAVFYLLDYLTKNPTQRASTAAVVLDAQQHVAKFPSQAADSGSDQRNTRHHINRVMNALAAKDAGEYPLPLTANSILGAPAEQLSHNVVTINLNASFNFIRQHMTEEQLKPDFGDFDERADGPDVDLFGLFLRPTAPTSAAGPAASAAASSSSSSSSAQAEMRECLAT